ncbi:MAG TPA: helix-turn-helix transcriptional regulator [Myxococcota bacterium]|nr:helix-turn-helix transcriptional regulator [Myxococcota bacterium]
MSDQRAVGSSPLPGGLLREARVRAGLTQRDLAWRARTSQSVVARIEQGRSDPSTG